MPATVTLKIRVHSTGQSKTIKFELNSSVGSAVATIAAKIGPKDAGDPKAHGLFVPKSNRDASRWLNPLRSLADSEVRDGMTIQYRKKERPLKVKLEDGTVKTVVVDDTCVVERLVMSIGKKMGLKNPEEFSLQSEKKQDWLNKALSLSEQGVSDAEAVVLKKKFFVHDANIDRSDPVQLHLVYAQCVNSITRGDHPLSDREAGQLAALQLQIISGNFNPSIHGPGFLEKEKNTVLPPAKRKGSSLSSVERECIDEYKKLVGMTEVNAKFRYIQDCRKLKTYGITTFDVERKVSGKKKALKQKLGVTRDAVLTIDNDTNEIIREYPLTHLRRWAAATKTFTLDFGDYEDDYMTLVTPQAEAISQLIGGYIDILLKKRKDGANVQAGLGDEIANVEAVAPVRGMVTATHGVTTAARGTASSGARTAGGAGGQSFRYTQGPSGQQIVVSGLAGADRAILKMNQDALQAGAPSQLTREQFEKELLKASDGAQKNAAKLSSQVEAAAPDNLAAWGAIDATARDLGMDVGALLNAARGLAFEGNPDLLNAARAVAEQVAKMMAAAEDVRRGKPGAAQAFKTAQQQFETAHAALAATASGVLADPADSALLLAAAKGVAAATAELLRNVRDGEGAASMTPAKKGAAMAAADNVDLAARGLLQASKMLAPVAADKHAQAALGTHAGNVKRANAGLLAQAKAAEMSAPEYKALIEASKAVSDAIGRMLLVAENAEMRPQEDVALANAIKRYTNAAANAGESGRLGARGVMEATKKVAAAQNDLLGLAKARATAMPPGQDREPLLAAAKGIAAATQSLVDAAKAAAKAPRDAAAAGALRQAGADAQRAGTALQQAVGDAAGPMVALKSQLKYTGAAIAELSAATPAAKSGDVKNDTALLQAAAQAADAIATLLAQARGAPASEAEYKKLAEATRGQMPTLFAAVTAAKRQQPRVLDPSAKQDLGRAAADAQAATRQLGQVSAGQAGPGKDEFTQADRMARADIMELQATLARAQAGQLTPASEQDVDTLAAAREGALQLLTNAAKDVARSGVATAKAMSTPAALPTAAKATAVTASQVASASRALAEAVDSRDVQVAVLTKALATAEAANELVASARATAADPHDAANRRGIAAAAKLLAQSVAELVQNAKLTQTSATEAGIAVIDKAMRQLNEGGDDASGGNWKSAASRLTSTAKTMESSGQALANARNKSSQDAAATRIVQRVPLLVTAAHAAAAAAPDSKVKDDVLSNTQNVLSATSDLFDAASAARSGKEADMTALLSAAKGLADSVALLSRTAETLSPVERAMEDAVQTCADNLSQLQAGQVAAGSTGNVTYQQATQAYTKAAKDVLRGMAALQQSAKGGNAEASGDKFTAAAATLHPFVQATALACAVSPEGVRGEFLAASEAVLAESKRLVLASRATVAGANAGSSAALTGLAGQYKATAGSVKSLIDAVAAGATGARAIEAGVGVLERLAAELDAGIYDSDEFSHASGSSNVDQSASKMAEHARAVQHATKAFIELAPGVAQDTLGETAQAMVTAVNGLVDQVKELAKGLAEDEGPEAKSQQAAVIAGAQRVLGAARDALKNGSDYFADANDGKAKQNMVSARNDLEAGLRSVANAMAARDASPGEQALASASSSVQELLAQLKLDSTNVSASAAGAEGGVEADDVVGAGSALAQEAAGLVGVTDDDSLTESAELTVSSARSLVDTTLAAVASAAVDPKVRNQVCEAAAGAIQATVHLLNARKEHASRQKPETQRLVSSTAATVAQKVNDLTAACEAMPRARRIVVETDDANLEDAASSELAACAAAIAEATSLLESRPRRSAAAAGLDAFDAIADAVLDAATSIALATQELVRAATKAQKEIKVTGAGSTTSVNVYRADPQWAKGLISAASSVAGGVKYMVAVANRATDRQASDSELIAAGRQVNSATVRLVSAARVKVNPASSTMSDLSGAAGNVQRANAEMLEAAKQYAEVTEEADDEEAGLGAVARIRKRREQESELARLKLLLADKEQEYLRMNKQKYEM